MGEGRLTRRTAIGGGLVAAGWAAAGLRSRVSAAPPVGLKSEDVPPPGHLRVGPFGFGPAPVIRPVGVPPLAMRIDKVGIDAQIEYLQIDQGVMQNPTGPWIVGWYEQTGGLGQFANLLFAGHVDYWNVGPAVFWDLKLLEPGDPIVVVGEDGLEFTYAVTWSQNYAVASLTAEAIGDIVGPTKRESVTLITCGGTFDYSTGEYDNRFVVRAERIHDQG
jgi:hypothetical protein